MLQGMKSRSKHCSPYRVPIARLACAQAKIASNKGGATRDK